MSKKHLTVEEIKKCIEEFKPAGFRMASDDMIYLPDHPDSLNRLLNEKDYEFSPLWETVYYPLFLQRVIEGISKSDTGFKIESYPYYFRVYSNKDVKYCGVFNHDERPVDEAKIEMIKTILGKL